MLNSRKSKIIISLIVAIALWAYVVGEIDPRIKKTYHSVPIRYTNEQTLVEKGLSIYSVSEKQMSVTLSGKRSMFTRMDSSQLYGQVDLSDAAVGTNELAVELNVPGGLESTHQSLTKVVVRVEQRVSQKRAIQVSYMGNYDSGEEPTTLSISPASVTVSGAESLVKKVSYVRATVQKKQLTGDARIVTASLKPVDSKGYEVRNVTLSQQTVHIRTALYKTKSVKLNLSVTGGSDGTKTYDAPDRINIKGPSSSLKKISEIDTKDIDISNIDHDQDVAIEPILPDGVQLASDSEDLKLSVHVKNAESSKSFTFDSSDVEIQDLGSDYSATVEGESVKITVYGSKSQIDAIGKGDISLSAAAGGLSEGTHDLPVAASCSKKYSDMSISPQTVSVHIVKS